MNKQIKKDWLAALRSGEYKQGRGLLYQRGRYCCLGVLYDVAADDDWIKKPVNGWTIHGSMAGLSREFRESCGISFDAAFDLIDMNDGSGKYGQKYSFAEIADWIEVNL